MTAPDDMIAVSLRRDEWGRVLAALRMARRKAEKDVSRPGFDPLMGAGAVARLEGYQAINPQVKRQVGDTADDGD